MDMDEILNAFPNLTEARVERLRDAFLEGLPPGAHTIGDLAPPFAKVCEWADSAYALAAILAGIERGELLVRVENGAVMAGRKP